MIDAYELDVCSNFVRIGVADVFRFAGVERRNEVGEWQVEIPAGGIAFSGGTTISDVDSIIVWDLGTNPASIVFAGVMASTGSGDAGLTTRTDPNGTGWRLSGVDLFGILGQRLAYPDPASDPQWSTAYDTRTGVASTVAAGYISANIGPSATARRIVDSIAVTDGFVGGNVTWTARLQPLSTLITTLCNATRILCRPRMLTAGVIEYVLTTGAARTARVVISEHDISGAISVTDAEARATYVIAGGAGALTSRAFRVASTGAQGLNRIESFYDVSSLTDEAAISMAADGQLIESEAETAVEFDTLLPGTWRYRDDYDIGDSITVEVDDVRHTVLVDAVAFTITPTVASIRPLLGRTTNNEAARIMRTLWGTRARFNDNIA